MRKALLFISAALALASTASGQSIQVSVDGQRVNFTGVGPQSIQGRVLVPLRGVLEQMGATVEWNAATRVVNAVKGSQIVALPIGSRYATVNGQPVTLDVPAMVMSGTTMVPLRFVGEAMGSDVGWSAPTRTVQITTYPPSSGNTGSTGNTGSNPSTGITSFTHNASDWLRAGSKITVVMNAQAGGTAVFQIPGVVNQVNMTESPAGRYTGSWTVPSNSTLEIENAAVIGRLTVAGKEQLIQAGNSVSIDAVAPKITNFSPQANATTAGAQPGISATLSDGGSGVNLAGVRIELDNKNVTTGATITPAFAAYKPSAALAKGQHNVLLSVSDKAGNTTQHNWNFSVQDITDIVKSFSYTPAQQPDPGETVTVSMVAAPGGKGSFSIGDKVLNIGMAEVSAGNYQGEYTVKRTDDLQGELVSGVFTSASGQQYTVTAETRIGGGSAAAPSRPTITAPAAQAAVASPVTIRGTAAAGSDVVVRVQFQTDLAGAIPLTGVIGQRTARSDANGNWEAGPFDLRLLIKGQNTRYTATATAENQSGESSESAEVTFTTQ